VVRNSDIKVALCTDEVVGEEEELADNWDAIHAI
jgi:hypothetical protein